MAVVPPDEEERIAYCEWLTANGINVTRVPRYDHDLRIEEHDGQRFIHYTEFVLTDDGHIQVDPDDNDRTLTRETRTLCRVEPPSWLRVPGGPT